MPSAAHDVLVELFGQHPEALADLVSVALHKEIPLPLVPFPENESIVPSLERRLDRVYFMGSKESPSGFLILEIQREDDPEKLYSWPLSFEILRSKYHVEGDLLVLALSSAVSRWILRSSVEKKGPLGTAHRFEPVLISAAEIPVGPRKLSGLR